MWRTWTKDVGLAAAVLLAQSAPFLFAHRVDGSGPWRLVEYLPVLASALPVVFRRKAPLVCLLLVEFAVGAYALVGDGPEQPIWFGALVCLYTVAHQAPRSHQVAALLVTGGGFLAVVGSVTTAVRELLTWSAAFALGALARKRAELAAAGAVQAAELATARERARIAADLHDILGHSFSMMVVQAEAGAAVAGRRPERAIAIFDAIADTGRKAMGELRTAVSGLRDDPPTRSPKPGIDDLPDLVRQAERAGLVVRLRTEGTPRHLPAAVHLAAYRVAQEAMTNVVKHARARTVELRTDWTVGAFRLTVTDDGVGTRVANGADRSTLGGDGHGLSGMRERVAAVGGDVTVGARPDGRGFRVEAVFR
ncbi:sensor histidine kinase [Micromonospora zhanjiangensis]